MKRVSIPGLLPIVVLLLAGCGSSSKSSSTPAAATAPAQSSSTPSATSTAAAASAAVITTKHNKLGTVLAAGPKRLTVYLFEADTGSTSTCTAACAQLWPPVSTAGQARSAGHALAADLGTTTRPDGITQVTYKGHPLYYYAKDGDVSDAYGAGIKSFGAKWYVLAPSGKKIDNS
jgi:predicted lipoprotein with Yx(FWY)xxD motif